MLCSLLESAAQRLSPTFDVRGWPQASPLDGGVRRLGGEGAHDLAFRALGQHEEGCRLRR